MRAAAQFVLGVGLALAGSVLATRAASVAASGGYNRSFRGDSAKLTVESPLATPPRFGFVPLRLTAENQLARDVEWQATFSSSSSSNTTITNQQVHDSFVVPGGRTQERWLFVPVADDGLFRGGYMYRGPVGGTISGPGLGNVTFTMNNAGSGSPFIMVPWAVSASLEGNIRTRIGALPEPPRPSGSVSPRMRPGASGATPGFRPLIRTPYNIFAFEPGQPLGDWRIWSSFARVVLRHGEFAALDAANRVALRNWVAMGGKLYLAPEIAREGAKEYFGAGEIVTLAEPIAASATGDNEGLLAAAGLLNGTLAQPFTDALSQERTTLSGGIPRGAPPGDWLAYFFVLFAVIVAPVNLFALAPARRRHRLFFTVPAISLVTVVGLGAIILLQDGFGGRGARRALVVLLPGDNQAAVFQEQVSRTGMLLGSEFPLANDVICAQLPIDGNLQSGKGATLVRNDGRASGDWFRSRSGQAQHLRRLMPTRARVERVGMTPDGGPVVQSSVGATLRDFCYVDSAGKAWGATTVPPGTRVNLTRLPDDTLKLRAAEFGGASSIHFNDVTQASVMPDGLARGRFVALAGDSDLAPLPTLDAIRWDDSVVLLTGVLENADGKPAVSGKAGE